MTPAFAIAFGVMQKVSPRRHAAECSMRGTVQESETSVHFSSLSLTTHQAGCRTAMRVPADPPQALRAFHPRASLHTSSSALLRRRAVLRRERPIHVEGLCSAVRGDVQQLALGCAMPWHGCRANRWTRAYRSHRRSPCEALFQVARLPVPPVKEPLQCLNVNSDSHGSPFRHSRSRRRRSQISVLMSARSGATTMKLPCLTSAFDAEDS